MYGSFRISKSVLQGMLTKIAPALMVNSSRPILQCVELEGDDRGTLKMSATKLDTSMILYFPSTVSVDPFKVVFPYKKLRDIVAKSDPGDLEVTITDGVATILSGAAAWELQLPSGESFPDIPEIEKYQEVDRSAFRDAFELVRKSASLDVIRPSLRMIHLSKAKMTACDGVKFTQMAMSDEFPYDLEIDISSNSADVVLHFLKEDGTLEIGQTSSHLGIRSESGTLILSKPTSSYPNVEQIMLRPALENKSLLIVDRSELLKAVQRVRLNADPATDAVGLSISAKSVTISARDMLGNSATETIAADWTSKDRVVVVSWVLFTQLLSNFANAECQILLGEDTKSRKSVILMKDTTGLVSLIPQMSGNIKVF